MTTTIYIIIGTAFLFAILYLKYNFIKHFFKWRGKRLVTCPETKTPTGVEVDARHAAITATIGESNLLIKECTHWPERQNCGQECLQQVQLSPENCLVWNILSNWFKDRHCAYCRKEFTDIHWHDHKPALRSPEGDFIEWSQIPVEKLPTMLKTHMPVCWNCFIAENFRKQYPELVVDHSRQGRDTSG